MITHNKAIFIIIVLGLYLEQNRILVFCDNLWSLKWSHHFTNNYIDQDTWSIKNIEFGKTNKVNGLLAFLFSINSVLGRKGFVSFAYFVRY